MHVTHLFVENFRGFEEMELDFSAGFNVLAGANGSGKTSLLDALSVGLGGVLLGVGGAASRNIKKEDIRRRNVEVRGAVTYEPKYPCRVTLQADLYRDDILRSWTREVWGEGGRTTRRNAGPAVRCGEHITRVARNGADEAIPIISYHSAGRRWLEHRGHTDDVDVRRSRLDAYSNCLTPLSDKKELVRWWRTRELQGLQDQTDPPALQAVRAAVSQCVVGAASTKYSLAQAELVVVMEDGRMLPFTMMSDGQQATLSLVADIARRCALANPHLGSDAPRQTPGVVLIDELEVHLHPTWQQRIVQDLRSAFPLIQFITTSHSPFILQSIAQDELIDLDGRGGEDAVGESIEDIAELIMGVDGPSRSRRYWAMMNAAERYYELLDEGRDGNEEQVARTKEQLDELLLPFGDNPAYVAFLRRKRLRAGLGTGDAAD